MNSVSVSLVDPGSANVMDAFKLSIRIQLRLSLSLSSSRSSSRSIRPRR
ncbi:hypothetical protein M5D96_001552, partial [Drosophila gunungcola]